MADGIRKLQQDAASCTDELLDISRDISEEVLPLYTVSDRTMFDLQCRLQMKRCERVSSRLEEIRQSLEDELSKPGDKGAGESADAEKRNSAKVTLQIIAQNLAIAGQKKLLLKELLIGSLEAKTAMEAAEKLKSTAEIAELKKTLGKELKR